MRVGHATVWRGDSVRTGVTAILPHAGNLFQEKVPAAVWTINGFSKAAGFLQVQELGVLETPIVLTNTLAVGTAIEAVVRWSLAQPGNGDVRSVNAVVGETNDGWLSDIRSLPVTPHDVLSAIGAAAPGSVAGGSIGAGTGTRALGFKGGIGTASRVLPAVGRSGLSSRVTSAVSSPSLACRCGASSVDTRFPRRSKWPLAGRHPLPLPKAIAAMAPA